MNVFNLFAEEISMINLLRGNDTIGWRHKYDVQFEAIRKKTFGVSGIGYSLCLHGS